MKTTITIITLCALLTSCGTKRVSEKGVEEMRHDRIERLSYTSSLSPRQNINLAIATKDIKPLPRGAAFVADKGNAHVTATVVGDSLVIVATTDSHERVSATYEEMDHHESALSFSKTSSKESSSSHIRVAFYMIILILALIGIRKYTHVNN